MGLQIYEKFKAKILQHLNLVQNEGLKLCIGAFRSSQAVSLSTETGILPLEFSRNCYMSEVFLLTVSTPKLTKPPSYCRKCTGRPDYSAIAWRSLGPRDWRGGLGPGYM